jgi:hypothetical protein
VVVRLSVLDTDVALSAPLAPTAPPARADRLVTVEASAPDAAVDAAKALIAGWPEGTAGGVHVFRLLWSRGR